jgi:DNA-binding response OmpR family regulator
MKILIAEDDRLICAVARRVLEEAGFEVSLCHTAQGVASAAAGADAVLLDLGLLGGDGAEALAELRRGGNEVPVILLTARPLPPGEAERMGAQKVIPKPFDAQRLPALVLSALPTRER